MWQARVMIHWLQTFYLRRISYAPFVTHKIKGKIEAWVTGDFLQSNRGIILRKNKKTYQDYFNSLLTDEAKWPKQLWKTLVVNGKKYNNFYRVATEFS